MTRNSSPRGSKSKFQLPNLPKINIKLETTKRIIIFSIATLILGAAQCSFFPILNICPRTPDLIMGLILAAALCDNSKTAMILSIGAGFFIDAIGGTSLAFSPIIYFVYAVIISLASQKMLKRFPAFILLLLPSLAYRAIATTILTLVNGGAFGTSLIITLLLEALCTFLLCLPIYPIILLATKPLTTHKKFTF